MKQITLQMSDKVFNKIKTFAVIQKIAGNSFGIVSEFIIKLITSIERGDEVLELKLKEE